MKEYNDPFYFAIADGTPTVERAKVPGNIRSRFGIDGLFQFVRAEDGYRLYKVSGLRRVS